MARRQLEPAVPKGRAPGAVLLLAGCLFTIPAIAATPHHVLCSESDSPTLEVHIETLTTEIVSHDLSPKPLEETEAVEETEVVLSAPILEPRARKAIREAFRDELIETSADEIQVESDSDDVEIEEEPPRVMNTQLPGVTQEKTGTLQAPDVPARYLTRFLPAQYCRDAEVIVA